MVPSSYFLRRPRIIRMAPALRAKAVIPVAASISGTVGTGGRAPVIETAGVPKMKSVTVMMTGNVAFANPRIKDLLYFR